MKKTCTVPMGMRTRADDGTAYYVHCGLDAEYKVGYWYVCGGHKKHYTDPNKWPAEPLEGEIDDETNES